MRKAVLSAQRRGTATLGVLGVLLQAILVAWHGHLSHFPANPDPAITSDERLAAAASAAIDADKRAVCSVLHHLAAAAGALVRFRDLRPLSLARHLSVSAPPDHAVGSGFYARAPPNPDATRD